MTLNALPTASDSVSMTFSGVAYLSAPAIGSSTSATLTFTHFAAIFNVFAGQSLVPGDSILLNAVGSFNGTSQNNITVSDDSGPLFSITLPIVAKNPFTLLAKSIIESGTSIATTVTLSCNNQGPVVSGVAGTVSVGSPTVMMTSTAGIVVGGGVIFTAGTFTIPSGTIVAAINSATQVTLSANVGGATGTAPTITFTAGSSIVTSAETVRSVSLSGTQYNLYLQDSVATVASGNNVTFDSIDWRARLFGE